MKAMWNSEMYIPAATYRNNKLNLNVNELTNEAGVYLLDFGDNNLYIGSTINIKSRISQHLHNLKMGSHVSVIQNVFDETKTFDVYILLLLPNADEDVLRNAESSMINLVRPRLNLNQTGISSLHKSKRWEKVKPMELPQKTQFWVAINSANGPKVAHFIELALTMIREEDETNFIKSAKSMVFSYITKTYANNPRIMEALRNLLCLINKADNNK